MCSIMDNVIIARVSLSHGEKMAKNTRGKAVHSIAPVEDSIRGTKRPVDVTTIHTIFGAVFGIWVGLIFSRRLSVVSIGSAIFVFYALAFIGLLTIILHAAFTRNVRGQRYFAYGFLFICCLLTIPGLSWVSTFVYPANDTITPEELGFVIAVLLVWCATAESSLSLNGMFSEE